MAKPLAIKPTDDNKSCVNAIGRLLGKTLPLDWEKAILYIEKNNNVDEWKGAYSSKGSEEISFILDKEFIADLENLRNEQKYRCLMSEIIFYSNNKYEIKYQIPEGERLSINEIQETIGELKKLDLQSADVNSLKRHISAICIGYMLQTPIIQAGRKLYRGIPWQEKPHEISRLSYPPEERVDKFHRAGRPNEPLFYCSTAREAVFYELGVHTEDRLVVSEWETTDSLLANNVGYAPDTIKKLGSNRTMPTWSNNERPEGIEQNNLLVQQFLADEFTKIVPSGQEHEYKLSVAIAEHHFGPDMFDGLLYPAIAVRGNADNLAIKPMAVDEKLVLKKVEYIQVTDDSNGSYKITMLDFANSFTEDGRIEWKGRLPHWVLRNKGDQLTVAVENGKWVARNTDGEVVEPE
ncbi:MAG: hypothetical protein KAJ52_07660 [Sedimentisphaerales bacterium]|nr:hypothetical protein [Sedimentisphaerales bacterium]